MMAKNLTADKYSGCYISSSLTSSYITILADLWISLILS